MFLLSQTERGHLSTPQVGQLESSPCEVRNERVDIEQKTSSLPKEADPNSWSRLTHQSHLQKSTSFNQGQFVGSHEGGDVLGSCYANSGCISSVLMPSKIHLERTQGKRAGRFCLHWGFLVSAWLGEREMGSGSDVCFDLWQRKGRSLDQHLQSRRWSPNHWIQITDTLTNCLKANPLWETLSFISLKEKVTILRKTVWSIDNMMLGKWLTSQKIVYKCSSLLLIITEIAFVWNIYICFTVHSK